MQSLSGELAQRTHQIKNAVLSQKIILAKHELTNQYLANAEAIIQNPLNVLLM